MPLHCLVTSIGSLSAGSVISSLREIPEIRISGTNSTPGNWIFHANCVDHFHEVPHSRDNEALTREFLRICLTHDITHIIALTDLEVDLLSKQRQSFEALGVTVCIPSSAAITICRDKWLMYQQFRDVPAVPLIPSCLSSDAMTSSLPYPRIAKPRKGRSSEGIVKLDDQSDFSHFLSKSTTTACVIQPLLPGAVHVVDLVRQQSTGKCAVTTRVELLRTANGAGVTVQMTDNPSLQDIAIKVAELLKINGCINLEFIEHEDNFFLMDINPRFSAGIAFSKIHGYDMVRNHLRCHLAPRTDIDLPPINTQPCIITRHYIETSIRQGHCHATPKS